MLTNNIEKHATSTTGFELNHIDPSWRPILIDALKTIDPIYLNKLYHSDEWLPGANKIFNAFSLPLNKVNYVLFGESPYPRAQSANGYAFWDAAVTNLWSETGLSKTVNRATSLRNIMKMLLIANGRLDPNHTSQPDIAALDKIDLIQTNDAFFNNFLKHGVLLLNATPVLQKAQVRQDARIWKPFIKQVMHALIEKRPQTEFILLGNIANEIDPFIAKPGLKKFYAEHPYNISFINNPTVLEFFKPFQLLNP
jgi:uracil-DNA glycosylase